MEFLYCCLTESWGPNCHGLGKGGFRISYSIKDFGFGCVTFFLDSFGKLFCDSETCSRKFVKRVLDEFQKRAQLVDGNPEEKEPEVVDT
jgi:hypothetical protein